MYGCAWPFSDFIDCVRKNFTIFHVLFSIHIKMCTSDTPCATGRVEGAIVCSWIAQTVSRDEMQNPPSTGQLNHGNHTSNYLACFGTVGARIINAHVPVDRWTMIINTQASASIIRLFQHYPELLRIVTIIYYKAQRKRATEPQDDLTHLRQWFTMQNECSGKTVLLPSNLFVWNAKSSPEQCKFFHEYPSYALT